MKDRLPGTVKFIFQPAEEGAPMNERPAGAELMVNEGVMQNPKVDAVFGLRVFANVPTGTITYRSGPVLATSNQLDIIVTGKQTHGSAPWRGVDPIFVGAQIVTSLQQIVSRNVDIRADGGGRWVSSGLACATTSFPETAWSARLHVDPLVQEDVHVRIKHSRRRRGRAGATVDVRITKGTPVTPTIRRSRRNARHSSASRSKVKVSELITGEDFTFFQKQAPGPGLLPRHHAAGTGRQVRRRITAPPLFRGSRGAAHWCPRWRSCRRLSGRTEVKVGGQRSKVKGKDERSSGARYAFLS